MQLNTFEKILESLKAGRLGVIEQQNLARFLQVLKDESAIQFDDAPEAVSNYAEAVKQLMDKGMTKQQALQTVARQHNTALFNVSKQFRQVYPEL